MAMRQTKLTDLWSTRSNRSSPSTSSSTIASPSGTSSVISVQSMDTKINSVGNSALTSATSNNSHIEPSQQAKRKLSVVELSSDEDVDIIPSSQPTSPKSSNIEDAVTTEDACSSNDTKPPKSDVGANESPLTTGQSHVTSLNSTSKISLTMRTRLISHFRGSMVGALIGDCYGARSEGRSHIAKLCVIDSCIQKGISRYKRFNIVLPYTDDTAMCHETAASLLACGNFEPCDMSRRYAENYFNEPDRGYGGNIGNTFQSWRDGQYKDVFESARRQFDGRGSYGNGAAMRIAPIPLFFHGAGDGSRLRKMVQVTLQSSRLTHTNMDGYNGGLLQALAIEHALWYGLHENRETFSPVNFVRTLEQEFVKYAESDEPINKSTVGPGLVGEQLRRLVDLVEQEAGRPVPASVVVQELGNGVAAHKSVPTAIYAFLWGTYDADIVTATLARNGDDSDILPDRYSPVQRTLIYAVSLGGDADTIASMACAISGAFYGIKAIPRSWSESCEACQRALDHSDDMVNNVLAVMAK